MRRKTLNAKVFRKIGFQLTDEEINDIVNCTPQTVERMLKKLQTMMAKCVCPPSPALHPAAQPVVRRICLRDA